MEQFCDLSNLRIETKKELLNFGDKIELFTDQFFHADIEHKSPIELRIRWNIKDDHILFYVQTALVGVRCPYGVTITDRTELSSTHEKDIYRFVASFCSLYSKLFQINPFHYMQKEEIEKIIQVVRYFDVNHLDISNLNLSWPKFIDGEIK